MKHEPRVWRTIIFTVGIGTFMGALDSSAVNVALPAISKHFNSSLATTEWVVLSYLLMVSSLMLTFGRLGDVYGSKKIYQSGFVIFTIGSLLCAIAPSMLTLSLSRAAQAIGAGMMMSIGPAIITENTPPENRGKALGMNSIFVSLAIMTGPIIGGLLTTYFGWQSIFTINLPIGVFGFWMGKKFLPDTKPEVKIPFDIPGAVLLFFTLLTFLFPLTYVEHIGWGHPLMFICFSLAVVLFLAFLWREKHTPYPMVDLSLFRNRVFSMSNVTLLVVIMALFSVAILLPFYFQQIKGLTPAQTGWVLLPQPITVAIVAPLSGILSDRFDSRRIGTIGLLLVSFSAFLMSGFNLYTTAIMITLTQILTGLGHAVFQTPNSSLIMGNVPPGKRGIAAGMMASMRNIGMIFGTAISGAIFTSRQAHLMVQLESTGLARQALLDQSFIGGFRTALLFSSGLALLAAIISLTRSTRKPAAQPELREKAAD